MTTSGEAVKPIAWGEKKLADMTLEQALEWVFTAPVTEQELVEADALLAQMAEVAERNRRSSGTSFVTMRMPKP